MLADKSPALNPLMPGAVRIFPKANFLITLRVARDVYGSGFPRSPSLCPVRTAFLRLEGTATQSPSAMGFWRTLLPRRRNPFRELRYEKLVDDSQATSGEGLGF